MVTVSIVPFEPSSLGATGSGHWKPIGNPGAKLKGFALEDLKK